MALNKRKIGDLIAIKEVKNSDGLELPFYGINKEKEFMPTVASTENLDRKKYKIMTKNRFVFSGMQTGRDMCIRIGLYNKDFDALISPAYTTFEVVSEEILPEYLFMIFKSDEMDRYGAFLSDSSVRANLDWDVFCNIELELPSIPIQKKYVEIYKSLLHNLEAYQSNLEDLKLVCDSYIEELQRTTPCEKLHKHIKQYDIRNGEKLGLDSVRGITTQKEFIDTKANMNDVSLHNYKVVKPNTFAYVADTSRRGDKISLSLNTSNEEYLVSSITTTFEMTEDSTLIPEYLFLFMKKGEFDRYARFHSWGSARETIEWSAFGELSIPIVDTTIQKSIVEVSRSYDKRRAIVEELKTHINGICPVLIRGAIQEGGGQ